MEIDEENEDGRSSASANYPPIRAEVNTQMENLTTPENVLQEEINIIPQTSISSSDNPNSQNEVTEVNETVSNTENGRLQQESAVNVCLSNQDLSSCLSPAKKKRSLELLVDDDDCQTCPICFDHWTTNGDHRLCALKCGHLFGYNCVKRWIYLESDPRCPTCKEKTRMDEVRYLYARKVIAMDDAELTKTKHKLDRVNDDKNRLQTELAQATCRMHMLREEVEEYKKTIAAMSNVRMIGQSSGELVTLYKEKTIDLGRESSCRVLDTKSAFNTIAISAFCMGYGARLINMTTFKPTAFILLHSQMIRDIKFHESKPWLLSCSVDKEVKILDINTNQTSITLKAYSSLWSCCWDLDNDQNLYVGQQQGSVLKFDIRKPTQPIQIFFVPGDYSPVVSIQAVKSSHLFFPLGGIISCKLTATWAFENTAQEPQRHFLPVEGPFVSMSLQKDHLFLSSRPNTRYPFARHFLCSLAKERDNFRCNIVHTFRGGNTQRMLARACLFSNKSDYAAAYIEDQHIVSIWNINNANKVGSVPARESVLDISSIKTAHADYLLTLTESKLRFFKFNS